MATKRKPLESKPGYMDATLGVASRVRDLLGRMTIEEKVRQMGMCDPARFLKNGRLSSRAVKRFFKGTSVGCIQDVRQPDPKESAEIINAIQKYLVENTRLGIPALVVGECLHGHLSPRATVFPQAIALASTWSPDLVRRMAEAAAKEARAVGMTQAFAPDLDLARDPRWGRVEETYGEDPYLVSRMGVAYIRGMQGEELPIDREHLVCTPKHYAAHGSPDAGVNLAPVAGGLRELYTVYLPPFRAAVTEAGALSVMPAYSEYDGVPAAASKHLLTRVLREEWGFQGYTFSDYGAVMMLHTFHKTAATPAEAGRQALEAGMDLEAPGGYGFGEALLGLAGKGEAPVSWIDRAVTRILRVKFLAGVFENPYADARKARRVVNCAAHRKLALDIARESIILLKNQGNLLPLDRNIRSVAVIGSNADVAQLGDYSIVNPAIPGPLQGIRKIVSRRTQVRYAHGCCLYERSRGGFDEAVDAARGSDAAILFLGGASTVFAGIGWGTEHWPTVTCGEGFDRADISLPGVQQELLRAVHATRTPTVAVLVHGRSYAVSWMAEHVPAVVEAWYPGEQGATALAEVLFGKVNPSGRLPVSIPRSVGHVPAFYNHKPSARGYYHTPGAPDKPGRDYVFSETTPLFAFGHGLSYTTFKYSGLRVSPKRILPGGLVRVSVRVGNSGRRAGKEVVQVYVNDVVSSVTTPVKALRRFEKVSLRPGEEKVVSFELEPEDLALLDENMNWTVEPGTFEVMVGGLKRSFEVVRPS